MRFTFSLSIDRSPARQFEIWLPMPLIVGVICVLAYVAGLGLMAVLP